MKLNNKLIHYFVEGKCEEKLINSLKGNCILSGKVTILNVAQKIIDKTKLRIFEKNTLCVMIVDTDVLKENRGNCLDKIKENQKKLDKNNIKYIFIYQDNDLEDEIVRSTKLKKIEEMYNVSSKNEHKNLFIKDKKLLETLIKNQFDIKKIWKYQDEKLPKNEAEKIKI